VPKQRPDAYKVPCRTLDKRIRELLDAGVGPAGIIARIPVNLRRIERVIREQQASRGDGTPEKAS
jgi:hypothetical protein